MLTREQLLREGQARIEIVTVNVPEWGGAVRVRALSVGERKAFAAFAKSLRDEKDADPALSFMAAMERLVLMSIVDDKGDRMFSDTDAALLNALDFRGYQLVRERAQELNGMIPRAKGEDDSEASPLGG